jgi:hypothetical protein
MMWLGREVLSLLGGHNSLYGEVSNAMGMIVNMRQYPQQTIVWNAAHGLQQQHTAGREIQWSLKIRGVADSGPYWGKELDFQILWVDEFAVRGSRLGGWKSPGRFGANKLRDLELLRNSCSRYSNLPILNPLRSSCSSSWFSILA